MGLISFAKSVGRKLGIGDDDDKKPQAQTQAAPAQGPSPEQVKELHERRKGAALVKLINDMGIKVDDLGVRVDGDDVTLTGSVDSQETREKLVLLVGNTEGTGSVNDQLTVEKPEAEAVFYEVKSGDTLSKIAKAYLGDANAYPKIFEINRDQLSDPDKIQVGQKLKLPPRA